MERGAIHDSASIDPGAGLFDDDLTSGGDLELDLHGEGRVAAVQGSEPVVERGHVAPELQRLGAGHHCLPLGEQVRAADVLDLEAATSG